MTNQLTPIKVTYQNKIDQIINQPGRRIEDVKFNPSNTMIALTDYARNEILLLTFTYETQSNCIYIVDYQIITSDTLNRPHGADFVNDKTLVVANRAGDTVEVYNVPTIFSHQIAKQSIAFPTASTVTIWNNRCLVCRHSENAVLEFQIDSSLRRKQLLQSKPTLIPGGLNIPDGLAVSSSGHRIAVSDHATHSVLIFDKNGKPVGALRAPELSYPHGLSFSLDEKKLYVADAGEQTITIFESGNEAWIGTQNTAQSAIKVIDDHAFAQGRITPEGKINSEEGGSKGLSLDKTGRLLVITCEYQPMSWFVV